MCRSSVFATILLAFLPVGIARAHFLHFETDPVRPLALSRDGELLFAANTPDNRVEIFRASEEGLERVSEVVVGLEPAALAVRGDEELWVVNRLSDSVSVVDIRDPELPFVRATLPVGDEPRDIVFAGRDDQGATQRFAYLTTAHRGQSRPGDPQLTTPGVGRADVWVFDSENLTDPPHILTLFCDTPRGLAVSPDGSTVYAAAFHSGNQTTSIHELAVSEDPVRNAEIGDGFTGLGLPPLPEGLENTTGVAPPETSVIVQYDGEAWRDVAGRDWSARVRFDLPDKDVFAIDATVDPPVVNAFASGVGTILFNLAVHPTSGVVWVTNLESHNLVRFEPKVRDRIADNRITQVDFAAEGEPLVSPTLLNTHIDRSSTTSTSEQRALSLSQPLDLIFSADGETLYTAAFGSYKVGVLDAAGVVQDRIDVGGGPCGLALDETRSRLYVLNRWDQTISVVDTTAREELLTVPLRYNPEPEAVRVGRKFLYDALDSSAHGDAACSTCHIFGDLDDLAWDLGNPEGEILPNRTATTATSTNTPLRSFHPMKGPMTTQSLRGLRGSGVMHWRGDRNGTAAGERVHDVRASFLEFGPAFQDLLGRPEEFPEEDMEAFFEFVEALIYPPNPIASLDLVATEDQVAGRVAFQADTGRDGNGGDGLPCVRCHAGASRGTVGGGATQNVQTQDFKVAHLRNLYTKVGMFGTPRPRIVQSPLVTESVPTPHLGDQVRGFGFRHDGVLPTIFDFLREASVAHIRFPVEQDFNVAPGTPVEPFKFRDNFNSTGDERARQIESFLLAFDTGLRPSIGQQVTLDADSTAATRERFDLLFSQANFGRVELVAHGLYGGQSRGFFFERRRPFQSDRVDETVEVEDLMAAIDSGDAVLTFTVVPRRGGECFGVDRDEDGFFDGDEIDAGTSPVDPTSFPVEEPQFLRGDCNDDGNIDISDGVASLAALFLGQGTLDCSDACDANDDGRVHISDALRTFGYLFLGLAEIPAPGTSECGIDPTENALSCESYQNCLGD